MYWYDLCERQTIIESKTRSHRTSGTSDCWGTSTTLPEGWRTWLEVTMVTVSLGMTIRGVWRTLIRAPLPEFTAHPVRAIGWSSGSHCAFGAGVQYKRFIQSFAARFGDRPFEGFRDKQSKSCCLTSQGT